MHHSVDLNKANAAIKHTLYSFTLHYISIIRFCIQLKENFQSTEMKSVSFLWFIQLHAEAYSTTNWGLCMESMLNLFGKYSTWIMLKLRISWISKTIIDIQNSIWRQFFLWIFRFLFFMILRENSVPKGMSKLFQKLLKNTCFPRTIFIHLVPRCE